VNETLTSPGRAGSERRPERIFLFQKPPGIALLAGAMNWILELQQTDAAEAKNEHDKKFAHRRYADAVVALGKAFALASASEEARVIRDEVGFFQAIRAALAKSTATSGQRSAADREMAIQQIISRAVVSTDIIDIMRAAGIESPDISILSDAFLAEVRDNPRKSLAIEALRKLINSEVQSRSDYLLYAKNSVITSVLSTVIGLASEQNHAWLREHDIVPVRYGDGQGERIREASGGKKSLDDVLRYLYYEFYKKGKNYTPADYQKGAEMAAGRSLDDFFSKYVRGTAEIDYDGIVKGIVKHLCVSSIFILLPCGDKVRIKYRAGSPVSDVAFKPPANFDSHRAPGPIGHQ